MENNNENNGDETPKRVIPYKDIRKISNDDTPIEPVEKTATRSHVQTAENGNQKSFKILT